MSGKISDSIATIEDVLSKRNYFILFILTSLILFAVFYVFTLATTTDHSIGIFVMMNGVSYAFFTFLLLVVIALLFGVYIALVVYGIKLRSKYAGSSVFGAGGLIVGAFSAGCPMCGAFLFGLFGAPLTLFFMPYKGLELRVLAMVLLAISIYAMSKNLNRCKAIKMKGG